MNNKLIASSFLLQANMVVLTVSPPRLPVVSGSVPQHLAFSTLGGITNTAGL